MSRLEALSELREALGSRRADEALQWLVDWLKRRDEVLDQFKTDNIASALEVISAEFAHEAAEQPSSSSSVGLSLAATVLADSADGVRVGDELTSDTVEGSAHAALSDADTDVTLREWNNDRSAPPA